MNAYASALRELRLRDHPTTRLAALILVAASLALLTTPAFAQSPGLQGLWRGSGHMKPAEGQRERVRCRVVFDRVSSRRYRFDARCASQSATISQTGEVRRSGRNRYRGQFYNSDYNIYGRISIAVQGNRQYVSLRSESGSGSLRLFKR